MSDGSRTTAGRASRASRCSPPAFTPLVDPIFEYDNAFGLNGGRSITGGYVYRGTAVPAAAGRYFYGDFCSGTIWSFKAGNGRLSEPRVEGKIDGLSSFGEDGNGELYAVSLNNGSLYKLR